MHEMAIAENLIKIIREEMKINGADRLRSVLLHVGALTAVVPEALSFSFGLIISGTELDGADLIIESIPLRGICADCGREFEIREFEFVCPGCEGTDISELSGQELSIIEMEVG